MNKKSVMELMNALPFNLTYNREKDLNVRSSHRPGDDVKEIVFLVLIDLHRVLR